MSAEKFSKLDAVGVLAHLTSRDFNKSIGIKFNKGSLRISYLGEIAILGNGKGRLKLAVLSPSNDTSFSPTQW